MAYIRYAEKQWRLDIYDHEAKLKILFEKYRQEYFGRAKIDQIPESRKALLNQAACLTLETWKLEEQYKAKGGKLPESYKRYISQLNAVFRMLGQRKSQDQGAGDFDLSNVLES